MLNNILLYVIFYYMNVPWFIHYPILGCFPVLVILNKAVINICVQVFSGHEFSTLLCKLLWLYFKILLGLQIVWETGSAIMNSHRPW